MHSTRLELRLGYSDEWLVSGRLNALGRSGVPVTLRIDFGSARPTLISPYTAKFTLPQRATCRKGQLLWTMFASVWHARAHAVAAIA
ncbi:MAG TPA: hypothetical protein VI216_14930 [Candidatus Acidoferrales bacterium]